MIINLSSHKSKNPHSKKLFRNNGKNETVILFGAHPDDVEIGMGGTVTKLAKLGYDIKLVIAFILNQPHGMVEIRKAEAEKAAKIMGCDPPQFLDLKEQDFIFNRRLVTILDSVVQKHKPDTVFTQWVGDSNQGHRILTRCALAASRRISNVLMYETTIPSLVTDVPFGPRLYVDISSTIGAKKKALLCHKTQVKKYGPLWLDAIVGRSAFRGFQIHKPFAEVFEVTQIVKW